MVSTPPIFARTVLAAVGFNHQLALGAGEVRDEWTDRFLPPEFEAAELPVAKARPQPLLRVGRVAPKPPRMGIDPADCRHGRSLEEEKPSPNPLP